MRPTVVLSEPAERAAERDADDDWNEYRIKLVEDDDGESATVEVDDKLLGNRRGFGGWTTRMPWGVSPRPAPGQIIRVWSNGSQNHGVTLIGTVEGLYDPPVHVYYTTRREREAERGWWLVNNQIRQREEFKVQETRLDELYDTLPPPLKARIDRFRAEDPDFRWREEAYEMASCAEAGRLYRAAMDPATGALLKEHGIRLPTILEQSVWDIPDSDKGVLDWPDTPEMRLRAIDAINSKVNGYNWKLQCELFPWIDPGHSGNTWGHAVKFAWILIRDGDEAKL